MVYIVRADRFWYKFDDFESAEKHYDYIFNNLDDKYAQIKKLYLAEYKNGQPPKILKIWRRVKEGEIL
jgi:hypothetical protein